MPRMTRKVFTDLALWMLALGIVVGLVFPPVLLLLGVPAELALRPHFVLACVAAGMVLAVVNHLLARRVVGRRITTLAGQMQYVSGVIRETSFDGDWNRCTPEECSLPVDSDDEMGAAAASFNELVLSLTTSRQVQRAGADLSKTLARDLEVEEFAPATLAALLHHSGGDAGILGVVRDGQLQTTATHRLRDFPLAEDAAVLAALTSDEVVTLNIDAKVHVSATLVDFRPAQVLVLPLRFRSVPVGVVILAFAVPPAPELVRLLHSFADPVAVALNNVLTHERFQQLAAIDPLTGTYNRRFGMQRVEEEWARAIRGDSPVGVLALDLDHFKAINDEHGHLTGDRVLRETALIVRTALREGDVLIRTGGEEFLVLLPGASVADVAEIGERIRCVVAAARVPVVTTEVRVTVSLGGASTTDRSITSSEMLLETADAALYASKHSGRNRVTVTATDPAGPASPVPAPRAG